MPLANLAQLLHQRQRECQKCLGTEIVARVVLPFVIVAVYAPTAGPSLALPW